MPCCTQRWALRRPIAQLTHRCFRPGRLDGHDPGSQLRHTVLGVGVGIGAPDSVVHVHGADVVPERPERVPEARGVGPAGDEAGHRSPGADQLVGTYECLDPGGDSARHDHSVTQRPVVLPGPHGRSANRGAAAQARKVSIAVSTWARSSQCSVAWAIGSTRAAGKLPSAASMT